MANQHARFTMGTVVVVLFAGGAIAACGGEDVTISGGDAGADGTAGDSGRDSTAQDSATVDSSPPPPDAAGSDASADVRQDVVTRDANSDDALSDSPADSPVDSPVDSPADAPVDSPADAPADAPLDAPTPLLCDGGVNYTQAHVVEDFNSTSVAGATLTANPCTPGVAITDATGRAVAGLPSSGDFYFEMRKAGYFLSLTGIANAGGISGLPDAAVAAPFDFLIWKMPIVGVDAGPSVLVFPDYDPTKALVVAAISNSGTTCNTKDGYVFTVTGHPEALVVYLNSQAAPDPSLTATSTFGAALLEKITPGAPVTLVGTKGGGCSIAFAVGVLAGKFPAVAGAITTAEGYTTP